jgi:hypothetical protein
MSKHLGAVSALAIHRDPEGTAVGVGAIRKVSWGQEPGYDYTQLTNSEIRDLIMLLEQVYWYRQDEEGK